MSISPVNNLVTKTGRNDPCPCGSGKKFKNCCLQRRSEVTVNQMKNIEDLNMILNISDSVFDEMKEALTKNLGLFDSHKVLMQIATETGSLGHVDVALHFASRALALRPGDNTYKLNMAVILGQADRYAEAFDLLTHIPDHTPRKTVIYGNLLRHYDSRESAIPFWEKAVEEEPTFYLPYANLIQANQDNPETKQFWIEKAYSNIPNDPSILIEWVLSKLDNQKYHELDEIDWISSLQEVHDDSSIIGQRSETIVEIDYLRFVAKTISLFKHNDTSGLADLSTELHLIPSQYQCRTAVFILTGFIEIGDDENVKKCFSALCPICSKAYSLDELVFGALRNSQNKRLAADYGKQILKNPIKNEFVIPEYLSLLDDIGETKSAIEEVKSLIAFHKPKFDFSLARIYFDLSIYAAKLGHWSLVSFALECFEKLDFVALLERGDYFHAPIAWNKFDQAVALMGQKEFKSAEKLLSKLTKDSGYKDHVAEFRIVLADKKEILDEAHGILKYAKSITNEEYFINKFSQRLSNSQSFQNLSGTILPIKIDLPLGQLISTGHHKDVVSEIDRAIASFRLSKLEEGDFSEALNTLQEEVQNIRIAQHESLKSLLEAETRLSALIKPHDYSPVVMSFCKGLEIFLRVHIFERYKTLVGETPEYIEMIKTASQDKKISQFRSLITFLENGRIEMGSMMQIIKLSSGSSAKRVRLLEQLNVMLDRYAPCLLLKETVSEIECLARDYRNIAVHEKALNEEDCLLVRRGVLGAMNKILESRLVK